MGIEIERKFLLTDDSWRDSVDDSVRIIQGYLANTGRGTIRVRLHGDSASLNIKSMSIGVSRTEFEYPIPVSDAEEMLSSLCLRPLIEKTRYYISQGAHTWEIDVFEGDNQGLVIAEIELSDAEEEFTRPGWLGEDVSAEKRYYNVSLLNYPFKDWTKKPDQE